MSTNDYLQGIICLLSVIIFLLAVITGTLLALADKLLAVITGTLLALADKLRRRRAEDRQRPGDKSTR